MSWFWKDPKESVYAGGEKHWAEVIKNSGPGDLLVWRQPEEDFNTNSTLIVMPGEEAIFIKGGHVESVFENGTYTLSTENYPFISRLRNIFTGGISTFSCVVFFVRKFSREIRWGTETPIQVRDKIWGIRTEAKARGAYKVSVDNSAQFLEKLLGNNVPFQFQEDIDRYFANEFQGKIKSVVSRFLNGLDRELVGLDAYIEELSAQIEPQIDEIMRNYGLRCVRFSIAGLDIDKRKYDVMDEAQIASVAKLKAAQGDKGAMDILGGDWSRQQAANILSELARNPGGGVGAVGAGIGVGVAAGNAFGQIANQMLAPDAVSSSTRNEASDPVELLAKLKKMLDSGLIERKEYDSKKLEILSRM